MSAGFLLAEEEAAEGAERGGDTFLKHLGDEGGERQLAFTLSRYHLHHSDI